MDGELLRWLYHRLLHDPTLARTPGCTYGDGLVAFIYFFAVLSDRSPKWACRRTSWPPWCRAVLPKPLISYSQHNRRLQTESLQQLIARLNEELRDRLLPHGKAKVVDGKPLTVGGYSHDGDAAWGKVPDGWANGYKLHAVADAGSGAIDAFAVTPLNAGEATVLRRQLIGQVDLRDCTLRGDANYDSNPTYRAVADAGGRHVAQRRKPGTGLGHHPQHPDRRRAVGELEQTPGGLADHRRRRNRVEQVLAHLGNLSFGLWALPPFVRRLRRVRRWAAAKITLYHLHLVLQTLAAQRPAA
jgi:IS5 family transposase